MKIDFKGSYPNVAGLVNAPRSGTGVHGPKLAELLPADPNQQITRPEFDLEAILEEQERGPMARMVFAPPAGRPPSLPPLELGPPSVTPKSEEGGVKTPTVLDARRIESAQELAALPRARRIAAVEDMVQSAGQRLGIDPMLSMAVVAAESSFDPLAVSQDGHASKGLFQLLDTTGKERLDRSELRASYNPFEPTQNVELGVGYLRHLHQLFSEPTELPNKLSTVAAANSASLEKLAVAAFNAGEGRVASAQARAERAGRNAGEYSEVEKYLPESTQEYVKRVMRMKGEFEARSIG